MTTPVQVHHWCVIKPWLSRGLKITGFKSLMAPTAADPFVFSDKKQLKWYDNNISWCGYMQQEAQCWCWLIFYSTVDVTGVLKLPYKEQIHDSSIFLDTSNHEIPLHTRKHNVTGSVCKTNIQIFIPILWGFFYVIKLNKNTWCDDTLPSIASVIVSK